jgi:hypothetical protein
VNDGYQVTTLAPRDSGPAQFERAQAVAVDDAGNVYLADSFYNVIWKITADGVTTVFAGKHGAHGSADGVGTNATFNSPAGVAVDGAGNVYVSDSGSAIRVITSNGVVSTLAGRAGQYGDANGLGSAARFSGPSGVAVDSAGNVYVADQGNNAIRKITPAGMVSTLAGGPNLVGLEDGPVARAHFEYPQWLAADAFGNAYVDDEGVRKIGTNGIVSTLAGGSGKSGSADGVGTAAQFNTPGGLAVDGSGNIFVVDTLNSTIRMITTNGVVTTQAGLAGVGGISDGVGSEARFSQPTSVAVDTSGSFYVADGGRLRKGFPLGSVVAPRITIPPQSQSGTAGVNVVFTVGVTGTPPLFYQWYHEDVALPGATLPSLTLTNALGSVSGAYSVVVTNSAGKATSAVANFYYVANVRSQTLANATLANGVFSVTLPSQDRVNYVLEYKNALTDPVWQTVGTTEGTGGGIVLSDSGMKGSTRFYRVVIQVGGPAVKARAR